MGQTFPVGILLLEETGVPEENHESTVSHRLNTIIIEIRLVNTFGEILLYHYVIFLPMAIQSLIILQLLHTSVVISTNCTGSFKEKNIIEKYHISDRKRSLMKYCLHYATIYKIKKIMIIRLASLALLLLLMFFRG
jgi:hypothetical protein